MFAHSVCPVKTSQPTATQAHPDVLQDYLHQGTRISSGVTLQQLPVPEGAYRKDGEGLFTRV